jgi:hypothetical protein
MKKHISEDLPARKHPQAQMSAPSKPQGSKPSGGDDKPISGVEKTSEERVSQAASDIRLRSRRENKTLKLSYDEYMQHSKLSEAEKAEVRKKLFGGGGMQAEDFEMDMKRSASDSMAKALYKVFVEKKNEVVDVDQLKLDLEEKAHFNKYNSAESKKYKVRVTDKDTKVTYVRYATREKINQLRAKGLEVEMTEYGTPYEGERTKGEKTAEVLSKKKKSNDGNLANNYPPYDKVTRGDVIAGRLGKDQMGGKNVKENFFLGEISATANLPQTDSPQLSNPDANLNQIDILPPKVKNKVVVNPTNTVLAHREVEGEVIVETGYSKFLGMLQEKKMTKAAKKKEKKLKAKYDPSGMKASMQKQYGAEQGKKVYFATIRKQAMKEGSECESDGENKDEWNIKDKNMDPRSVKTALNLAKTAERFKGARNPIVMVSQA